MNSAWEDIKVQEEFKRRLKEAGLIEEKLSGGMVEEMPDFVSTTELYQEDEPKPNKYRRLIKTVATQSSTVKVTADVYDILEAWNVSCPATQHAIKKLLQPGARGHKDTLQDLREAIASIERAIELEEARNDNG